MGQTAEELLETLTDGDSTSYITDPTVEPHIVIDSSRKVTVPDELKRIAVQFDHDIETVTFDCIRFWDGHDMSKMAIYVNYLTSGGAKDSYPVRNVTVDETDENIMHFDWTISRNATQSVGVINFLVCVKKTDDIGEEVNHWNSELNSEMYVSKGLECTEAVAESYSDLITLLLLKIDKLDEMLVLEDDGNGNVDIVGLNTAWTIADSFCDRYTYKVGDFVMYLGTLYKCIKDVETPGLFNTANWEPSQIINELKNCFQSVSDGKSLVASAITDMGVSTEATATFLRMADNIRSIETGVVAGGNAQPEDVTAGKTFINETGYLLYGTSTAAADLAALQSVYDDLVVDLEELEKEKDTIQAEKDTLQIEKDNLQTAYDEYKAAVVNGLQYSKLGVTMDTTPEELEAILLNKFPAGVDIFAGGMLGDDITIVDLTNVSGYLTTTAQAGPDGNDTKIPRIQNIDVTDYSKLTMIIDISGGAMYGSSKFSYGIGAWQHNNIEYGQGEYNETRTLELDVSKLSGSQEIVMRVYAESESDTYNSVMTIKIKEIRLT